MSKAKPCAGVVITCVWLIGSIWGIYMMVKEYRRQEQYASWQMGVCKVDQLIFRSENWQTTCNTYKPCKDCHKRTSCTTSLASISYMLDISCSCGSAVPITPSQWQTWSLAAQSFGQRQQGRNLLVSSSDEILRGGTDTQHLTNFCFGPCGSGDDPNANLWTALSSGLVVYCWYSPDCATGSANCPSDGITLVRMTKAQRVGLLAMVVIISLLLFLGWVVCAVLTARAIFNPDRNVKPAAAQTKQTWLGSPAPQAQLAAPMPPPPVHSAPPAAPAPAAGTAATPLPPGAGPKIVEGAQAKSLTADTQPLTQGASYPW